LLKNVGGACLVFDLPTLFAGASSVNPENLGVAGKPLILFVCGSCFRNSRPAAADPDGALRSAT
jgi:hypothetical protein